MASSSTKALISIGKVASSLVVGYLMYMYWSSVRVEDPWYYPGGAAIVCAVMIYFLLNKLNKGSGD